MKNITNAAWITVCAAAMSCTGADESVGASAAGGAAATAGAAGECTAEDRDIRHSDLNDLCCGLAEEPATCSGPDAAKWATPDQCCEYMGFEGKAVFAGAMNDVYGYYGCGRSCTAQAGGGGVGGSAAGSAGAGPAAGGAGADGQWVCTTKPAACTCIKWPEGTATGSCSGYSCCYTFVSGNLPYCECSNTADCGQVVALYGATEVQSCPP